MQTLIDLVKLGAIGASLAFLILSYRLLSEERSLKEPRPVILREIRRFRASALVFLIVGVFSEFLLTHGVEVIAAAYQLGFENNLIRVRFNDWEYAPEKQLLGFGFEENHIDTKYYVLPALRDQYDVYIGVRPKGTTPFNHGEYALVFGPYRLANQPRLDQTLSASDLATFGKCVELTAFGVPKVDGKSAKVPQPFDPDKFSQPISAFNTVGVCS